MRERIPPPAIERTESLVNDDRTWLAAHAPVKCQRQCECYAELLTTREELIEARSQHRILLVDQHEILQLQPRIAAALAEADSERVIEQCEHGVYFLDDFALHAIGDGH